MSDLLPHSRPPARRRRGLWILLGFGVLALAVVVAGFFFARRQIGEFSARKLGERLLEDGVFISWKSADWVPGGGVQLRGLALYRDPAVWYGDSEQKRPLTVSLGQGELSGGGYAAPARQRRG